MGEPQKSVSYSSSSLSWASVYQVDIEYAASQGVITEKEAEVLWPLLQQRSSDRFKSQLTNLFYYGGALLVIASMTWFTDLAWNSTSSLALFWLALAYVLSFGYAGRYFWTSPGSDPATNQIVGGLFTTVSVSISPMTIFALQRYFNIQIPYSQHALEVLVLVAWGLVSIYFVRFPFITAPIVFALYFWAEVDLPFLVWKTYNPTSQQASAVSMGFGLILLLISYAIDKVQQSKKTAGNADFAFWGYVFGLLAFWGALTHDFLAPVYSSIEFRVAYLLVNLILIAVYTRIDRLPFFLSGAFGVVAFVFQELYQYGTVEVNSWISIAFGAVLIATAMYQDAKKVPTNFPFWEYLVGVFSLFSGFWVLENFKYYHSLLFGFFFIAVHIGLLVLYVPTKENVFILFGVLGVCNYVGNMVDKYASAFALPILLTFIGLVLIVLAVWLSKRHSYTSLVNQQQVV